MDISLRFNILANEWVIIAPGRVWSEGGLGKKERPQHEPDCPYCPGNEEMTAAEIARVMEPGGEGWQVRVVESLRPALSPLTSEPQEHIEGLRRWVDGLGVHETIIDTPRHDLDMVELHPWEVEAILQTYRSRYQAIWEDERIAHIIIYKNQGIEAGTSLLHSHSHIIATPVVSHQVTKRLRVFDEHLEQRGQCLMCHLLEDELADGARIVDETRHFIAFIPFAALSPYHLWIFPRRHRVHFGQVSDGELLDLAFLLRRVTHRIAAGLDSPDYNLAIRSAPRRSSAAEFHWYLALVPRFGEESGFELGSGMFINPTLPEESASHLRSIELPEDELDPTAREEP